MDLLLKSQIDETIDALLERNQRILGLEAANRRDVSSLQRWVDGNACLAREETAFLARYEDLCMIAPPKDQSVTRAEAWVEDFLIRSYQWFRKVVNPCLMIGLHFTDTLTSLFPIWCQETLMYTYSRDLQ